MSLAGVTLGRKKEGGLGLRTLRLLYFKDKVFVGNRGSARKLDVLAAVGQAAHSDFMRNALYRSEFEAGVEIHGERDVVARARLGLAHRRSDSRCVRHGVAVRGPSGPIMADGLRAGDSARTYDHRENQPHVRP